MLQVLVPTQHLFVRELLELAGITKDRIVHYDEDNSQYRVLCLIIDAIPSLPCRVGDVAESQVSALMFADWRRSGFDQHFLAPQFGLQLVCQLLGCCGLSISH